MLQVSHRREIPNLDLLVVVCTRVLDASIIARTLDPMRRRPWPCSGGVLLLVNTAFEIGADVKTTQMEGQLFAPLFVGFEPQRGYASIRNRALDLIPSGCAMVFVDDDTVMPTNWIDAMWAAHCRSPNVLLGSLHARVDRIPESIDAVDKMARNRKVHTFATLSGTNGLLIPASLVDAQRFDTKFDRTGGEDTDYLLRMKALGIWLKEVPCVLLEEDRLLRVSWWKDAQDAAGKGHLWVEINRHNGRSVWRSKVRAALGLLPAILQMAMPASLERRRRRLRRLGVRVGVLLAH